MKNKKREFIPPVIFKNGIKIQPKKKQFSKEENLSLDKLINELKKEVL